ncbi:MAG: DUF3486 family protein [Oscillospiraceae bacterium]|nr:DUF3486 family protein [Oscillospiraceae bacterium]
MRRDIDDMLLDKNYTYREIIDYLGTMGIRISQSALSRYYINLFK